MSLRDWLGGALYVLYAVLENPLSRSGPARDAFTAGRVLVIVCLAMTMCFGGWLTGRWMTGRIEPDSVHTGYFLLTAAGGLIGADTAARFTCTRWLRHRSGSASSPGSFTFTFTFAFAFAYAAAAAAAYALVWLAITKPPGVTGYAIAVIVLLTAFVSWIAFRTVVLAIRGQLFPPWPQVDAASSS